MSAEQRFQIGDEVLTAERLSVAPVGPEYSAPLRRPGIIGVVKALPENEGGPYRVSHGEGGDGRSAYYREHELTLAPAAPTVLEQLDGHQTELTAVRRRLDALEQAAEAAPTQSTIEAYRALHRSTLDAYRALHRAAKAWRDWRMLAPMGGSARQEHEAPIIGAVQMLDELDIDPGPEPSESAAADPRRIPYEVLRRLYERLSSETAYDTDDPEALATAALAAQARGARLYVVLCDLADESPDDELPADELASRIRNALTAAERDMRRQPVRLRLLGQDVAELRRYAEQLEQNEASAKRAMDNICARLGCEDRERTYEQAVAAVARLTESAPAPNEGGDVAAARAWRDVRGREELLDQMTKRDASRIASAASVSLSTTRAMLGALRAIPSLLQRVAAAEAAQPPGPDDTAPPPSDAAAEVLAARDELAAYQQRVMVALGYDGVDGPDPEQALQDITTCAAPVRRLLEAYSKREIRSLAKGLRHWAADAPQHSVTRGGAEMLEQIAQLGNGDESP